MAEILTSIDIEPVIAKMLDHISAGKELCQKSVEMRDEKFLAQSVVEIEAVAQLNVDLQEAMKEADIDPDYAADVKARLVKIEKFMEWFLVGLAELMEKLRAMAADDDEVRA